MAKQGLERVWLKEDDTVHYRSCREQYGNTLCGCDGLLGMKYTTKTVTCGQCIGIVRHVHGHRRPNKETTGDEQD